MGWVRISIRDRGATSKMGGGGLTSDPEWGGGGLKTHFLSNSLYFSKTWEKG